MSQADYKRMSDSEKKKEDWMNSKWRPAMGWVYMITCTSDFILFPILWSVLQTSTGVAVTQWSPITLQGAGLYHLAMGAILGVAAWSRGQEKMAGVVNGYPQSAPASGYGTTSSYPVATPPARPVAPNRQLSEKSKRIIPSNDLDDADNRPKSDPEARG